MESKVMLKGVDLALYKRFKQLCVQKGLLIMPKASELFNKALNAFIVEHGLSKEINKTKRGDL